MSEPININLGCGFDYREGWINLDASARVKVDYKWNLAMPLVGLFPSNYADLVLAQDILEHLFRWQAVSVCEQVFTILKPGGTFIVRMPDVKTIMLAPIPAEQKITLLYGGQDISQNDSPEKARARAGNPELFTHRYGWFPNTFQTELHAIGFTVIAYEREWPNFTMEAWKDV